ncbi:MULTISPECIES: hypothetical protein [Streptomyces]|uniref:Transposase n=1 Tax=Streptomyces caniscabiei TaxID=2746961 RepID=A0ABU4MWL0_9ACTN|nr:MULTISPECIES: hypothetical protein [Streptomyces]MDX2939979.1 hypothetical protein [Streptomyces caniscabiei]MDX2949720.1 hypothetical protein [Streptomyces caniscabiei]MDX2988023.1 hypothetical protein [Streptomyces caniscabiei]MDX3007677.1 hypothetical protein [Streptomyces caniscabiei]MDX3041189.1 hypothetical protein [Streptomyces caniscabiei]
MTAVPGSPGESCWMDLKTRDLPATTACFAVVQLHNRLGNR